VIRRPPARRGALPEPRSAVRRAFLTLLLLLASAARAQAPEGPPPVVALNPSLDYADTRRTDGVPTITAGELGRLLGATRFWRADLRKLELRIEGHRMVFTVDNPFVVIDDHAVLLEAPVTLREGELHVPAELISDIPAGAGWPRLLHDPRRRVVLVVPPEGVVSTPVLRHGADIARISFPTEDAAGASVASRARNRFRIRFDGVFSGVLPDSMPATSLLRALRPIPAVKGCAFELQIAPEAAGFRVVRDPRERRVTLEFHRQRTGADEVFAPESPAGPRDLRLVVLDPGHGGADAGTTAEALEEKTLALDLARLLREELAARMPVRVLLTREDDRTLSAEQRAEFANRVRADLVISLHFDGFEGASAAGATAYCPPAIAAGGGDPLDQAGGWTLRAWRDIPLAHAVQSRALAEAMLSALELRGQGPTRLRETLPFALVGVDAPGILLECATLTSPDDRRRVSRPDGLRILASTLADGVEAYQRNQ
jgi:N-acetylmuramoyl-L-alanine amidase